MQSLRVVPELQGRWEWGGEDPGLLQWSVTSNATIRDSRVKVQGQGLPTQRLSPGGRAGGCHTEGVCSPQGKTRLHTLLETKEKRHRKSGPSEIGLPAVQKSSLRWEAYTLEHT